VTTGKRFEFGKNWKRFLSTLNEVRIDVAKLSLQQHLKCERLDGMTFLDVGSGSGLFSLAARRLGATVRSFDYDSESVACTLDLKHRFFPDDKDWVVEQGSILDDRYLASLGTYDIVYSWGVLHHTGAMQTAFDNIKQLVAIGGSLYISIYNELGEVTDHWLRIKQTYNRLPRPLRRIYALSIIAAEEKPVLLAHCKRGQILEYLRRWTEYDRRSTRGMSRWHDSIDWIGGYPYECASVEAVIDEFGKDGFVLTNVIDQIGGTGCNEFVFQRNALGPAINDQLQHSRFVHRQSGHRIVGPYVKDQCGYVGRLPMTLEATPPKQLILFRDDELLGTPQFSTEGGVVVAPKDSMQFDVEHAVFRLVRGELREIKGQFHRAGGRMFKFHVPEMAHLSENASDWNGKSSMFLFEDSHPMQYPRSEHAHIRRYGIGRYIHWGEYIWFSSSDNSDPNTNGRCYKLLICEKT
jgi:2-polyprenyl-6-hydroxyphenyl methylase/3-demethylubiquinone-9 3-methyltransferase